ncbi:hypothetical protein [Nocardioides jiangxiensis]|uniref:Uncharacterized protein n=1 Tax=Nocardioides jiangxiensis TaxID=3064524 RepID=A0ABT9B168_9ACTN|nr:hypothetical protein [Nocardioides sp. WY-20]MDO7868418.1 hypothetical protein [Nocardioides sp. WY-20]
MQFQGKRLTVLRGVVGAAALAAVLGTTAGCGVAVAGAAWREDPAASRQVEQNPVGFSCAAMQRWDAQPSPELPDRDEQDRIEEAVAQASGPGWRVLATMSTHLGVVALVDGDVTAARGALAPRGVARVVRPSRRPDVTFVDQVDALQAAPLGPVVRRLERGLRGRPGWGDVTPWAEKEAVVIQWKAPVPKYVRALAGRLPDGVNVAVLEARFSQVDLLWAARRIHGAADTLDAKVVRIGQCDDLSGLRVGMPPEEVRVRRDELAAELTHLAGLPVEVVADDGRGPGAAA